MMKLLFLLPLLVATTTLLSASPSPSEQAYIQKYKQIAIAEKRRTGVPVFITMAQGIIESGCGTSRIARLKHNHFGIKRADVYKAYASTMGSFMDHSNYFTRKKRYARLLKKPNATPKEWVRAIATSGYASDKSYERKLIACINRNELSELDKQAK